MDCREFHEELDLRFPSLDLSDKEKLHLKGCASCQQHWRRLQTMTGTLGSEEDFYWGDSEVERLIGAVNSRINDSAPQERAYRFRLRRLIPLAAAVILIMSVSLISLFLNNDTPGDKSLYDKFNSDSFYTLLEDPNSAELDEGTVEMLLKDLTSGHAMNAGELLLDDLTLEEFDYLMDNYDVRELL